MRERSVGRHVWWIGFALAGSVLSPTDAAFLSEVRQLNHAKLIPVIVTSADISPAWFNSVAAAPGSNSAATARSCARSLSCVRGSMSLNGDITKLRNQ